MYTRALQKDKRVICVYGPGGTYCNGYPPGFENEPFHGSAGVFGQLAILLVWLANPVIRALRDYLENDATVKTEDKRLKVQAVEAVLNHHLSDEIAKTWRDDNDPKYKATKSRNSSGVFTQHPDAKASGNFEFNSKIPQQQWLFPDYAGDGETTRHKQSNRVRARRNSGRKGSLASRSKQGTLFDT